MKQKRLRNVFFSQSIDVFLDKPLIETMSVNLMTIDPC